jgi:hypothetical protein
LGYDAETRLSQPTTWPVESHDHSRIVDIHFGDLPSGGHVLSLRNKNLAAGPAARTAAG